MRSEAVQVLRATTRAARYGSNGRQSLKSAAPAQWICLSCRNQQPFRRASSVHTRSFHSRTQRNQQHNTLSTPAATSKSLPSHSASRRTAFSKRLSEITDSVLARASIAGQHINTYTGTDYSGIEALRKEITEQEDAVRQQHVVVADTKSTHTEARAKQASSQKEIVGLLERKSSWSPADLERYMSLVRSEHVDDQAVQKATEELALAERDLEATRSLLEKLERKQYHEEQVWSDTIRRNSTWVTIGLMGVNILLLLAQISIFEPYRRRKIVKQIEEALDQRVPGSPQQASILQQIDEVVEPSGVSLEELEQYTQDPTIVPEQPEVDHLIPSEAQDRFQSFIEDPRAAVLDLFSERAVQLKQVDLTTIALEGVAAGVVAATMVSLLVLRLTH